jgi:hypothetical protein
MTAAVAFLYRIYMLQQQARSVLPCAAVIAMALQKPFGSMLPGVCSANATDCGAALMQYCNSTVACTAQPLRHSCPHLWPYQ